MAVLVTDDPDRLVQFGEVLRDVAAEIGGLMAEQAATVLAQVKGVEVVPTRSEELGQVGLEEVVDVAVHVEHRPLGRGRGPQRDQGRHDLALGVGCQLDAAPLVRGA